MRELATLYPAFARGSPSPLPEPAIQYADYAVWQREWLRGEVLERQLAYWREHLAGIPETELPTDYPRPPIAAYGAATHFFTLSRESTEALQAVSKQAEVTLFMILAAALKVLLHWYTRQADIAIGAGVANRNQVEIEGLIGFFVNVLVLRTDLSGNPTFREVLDRVRATCLGAYAHQDVPFEKLVAELRTERDLTHTPFFQVMFAMQTGLTQTLELEGLTLTSIEADTGLARFDLGLYMSETPDGLRGAFKHRTDLFSADTISRMVELFDTILREGGGHPDVHLDTLTEALIAADTRRRHEQAKALQAVRMQKFKSARRQVMGGNNADE
jgi:aspartate racemase